CRQKGLSDWTAALSSCNHAYRRHRPVALGRQKRAQKKLPAPLTSQGFSHRLILKLKCRLNARTRRSTKSRLSFFAAIPIRESLPGPRERTSKTSSARSAFFAPRPNRYNGARNSWWKILQV